jgi:hypothetical protein
LVVSSSPLTENLENIRRMEDAGASAIVLHSLFEEQVILDGRKLNFGFIHGEESYSESLNSFPDMNNNFIKRSVILTSGSVLNVPLSELTETSNNENASTQNSERDQLIVH